MRRVFAFLLVALVGLLCVGSCNDEFTYEDGDYFSDASLSSSDSSSSIVDESSSSSEENVETGFCNSGNPWTYNLNTKHLTISGDGRLDSCYFYFYDEVLSVTVEEGITSILEDGLYYLSNLRELKLPDSLTLIGKYAFYRSSIENLTIPKGVNDIEKNAFSEMELKYLHVDPDNQAFSSDDNGVLFDKNKTTLVAFPISNPLTEYVVPDSVDTIGKGAFSGARFLTKVTLGCSKILREAFYQCSNLQTVYYTGETEPKYEYDTFPNTLPWVCVPPSYTSSKFCGVFISKTCNISEDEMSGLCDEPFQWSFNKKSGILIISGTGYFGDNPCASVRFMSIANTVVLEGATSIGDVAFFYASSIKNLVLSESVTSIKSDAFYNVEIGVLNISKSVSIIEERAFYSSEIQWIVVDSGNEKFKAVDGVLFDKSGETLIAYPGLSSNSSYTIPNSVKTIAPYAFSLSYNLNTVEIPASVKSIVGISFDQCYALTEFVIDADNENYAVERSTLFSKTKETLIRVAPGCHLAEYEVPDTVKVLGAYSFSFLHSLDNITIPNSVTSIGDYAFYACWNLQEIVIPESVTFIGDHVLDLVSFIRFLGDAAPLCGKYVSDSYNEPFACVTDSYPVSHFCGAYAATCNEEGTVATGAFVTEDSRIINWTLQRSSNALSIKGSGEFDGSDWYIPRRNYIQTLTIEDGFTSIGEYGLAYFFQLNAVTIPDSVVSIKDYAFKDSYYLEDMEIGKNIREIGQKAFVGSHIEWFDVNVDNSFYSSLDGVLYNKDKSTLVAVPAYIGTFIVPDSVRTLAPYSMSVLGLHNVAIGAGVTTIDDFTLYDCQGLTKITVNQTNEHYSSKDGILYDKSMKTLICFPPELEITRYSIPNSVTRLASAAFCVNRYLLNITIPASVTQIDKGTFDMSFFLNFKTDRNNKFFTTIDGVLYDKNLTKLIRYPARKGYDSRELLNYTILKTVRTIGEYAFYGSQLYYIEIPNSVTTIDPYAFYDCRGMNVIVIPGSVTSIGEHAFDENEIGEHGGGLIMFRGQTQPLCDNTTFLPGVKVPVCVPASYNSATFCGLNVSGDCVVPEEESSSSSSLAMVCPDGKYADMTIKMCVECTSTLRCTKCSDANSCDECEQQFINTASGCVPNCTAFYGNGCSKCTDKKCLKCEKEECCRNMKYFWDSNSNKCVSAAEKFGDGCVECDENGCTKCTAQTCCLEHEYFDGKTCESCTDFGESCNTCIGSGCLECGESETIDSNGQCAKCESLFGSGCTTCDESQCTNAKPGHIIMGTNAIQCSELFGSECSECNSSSCLTCATGYAAIGGYCRSCSEVFGEGCSQCSAEGCINCLGGVIMNRACVNCKNAFGSGCLACNDTSCIGKYSEYFISHGRCFSCEVLRETSQTLYDCCVSGDDSGCSGTRDTAAAAGKTVRTEDGEDSITIEYMQQPIEILCSTMTANCKICKIGDNGEAATCTACDSGYVLVGGTCQACSERIENGECSECDLEGCTSCQDQEMVISNEGKCISKLCDYDETFDETLKTCISCSSIFHKCSQCNATECKYCQDNILHDGKCKTCKAIHGAGCERCGADECYDCTDDECCKEGTKIVMNSWGGLSCGTCQAFGDECAECSATECKECADGYAADYESGSCVPCSNLFDECGKCDSDVCLECLYDTWNLTDNGCFVFVPTENKTEKGSDSTQSLVISNSPVEPEPGDSNAGMIAGIVVGVVVVVVIVAVAVYCVVTSGPKHGKVNSGFMEEDEDGVSMSIL